MKPYFLYSYTIERESPGELEAAISVFGEDSCGVNVCSIPPNSLVIPRFRAIPFGRELEAEVLSQESKLVNSYLQHCSIANIFAWAPLLQDLTPACYKLEDYRSFPEGAYFLKGETNSLKNSWFTSSFAASKSDILKIASRIQEDLWTSQQEVVIRPFQNYRQLGVMVDGRPLFHERRAFFYEGELLSEAWYWSSCRDLVEGDPTLDKNKYWSTVGEAISRVKHLAPFLVIDFAE